MSSDSSQLTYPPSFISQYTIASEGGSLAGILYGIYLVIAGMNLSLLQKKRYKILWWYTVSQLVITTVYMGVSMYAGPAQTLAIFGIGDFEGPDVLSNWPSIVVNAAFVLNTWASDAFLLYRCYVVCMANKYAIILPGLLYLSTVGASIAWLTASSASGAVYSTQSVQVTGVCFWSFSVAMNVCASTLITTRLWLHRLDVIRAVGTPQGMFYLSYMAMTLESALLYTVFVIIALVVFILNSPLENFFFPVLGNIQVIAPSLIIFRIARGISFETDEYGTAATGTMRFASSIQRHAIPRPVHDPLGVTSTMPAYSEDGIHQCESGSFIHDVKDKA